MNWTVTQPEHHLIHEIAVRASRMAEAHGGEYLVRDALMDVAAAHANGCPLKLAELVKAEEFDFGHDIFGIRRHLNRRDGTLEDCFLPRYAKL